MAKGKSNVNAMLTCRKVTQNDRMYQISSRCQTGMNSHRDKASGHSVVPARGFPTLQRALCRPIAQVW